MISLELYESPFGGGITDKNGHYGGGTLWVYDYIPTRIHAATGELWMKFVDQPTVPPFKIGNVVPGQKVKIPFGANANLRLYLVSHDVTGRKTMLDLSTAVVKEVTVSSVSVAPPPLESVAFDPQNETLNNKTIIHSIYGLITFSPFNDRQTAKIFWKKPAGTEFEELKEVSPKGNLEAEFRADNLELGTHIFKAVVYNGLGAPQVETPTEYEIEVGPETYTINGLVIEDAGRRAYIGFDASGKYTGRDTAPVPAANINAVVSLATVKDNGLNVDFELQGVITDRSNQTSQSDSLEESEVTVYTKFGAVHKKIDGTDAVFHADYKGAGTLASGDFPRKYADPREEAYYKIRVRNSKGWSGYTWLYPDGTVSTTTPTFKTLANCPQNLSISTLSSASMLVNATFIFGGNTLKLQKREVGQAFADWTDHATGISALPYTATDLAADHEYEFRLVSSNGTNNASNIIRAKTWQIGQTAPERAAPSGLSVVPDPSDPDDDLKVDWVRNATDNDSVDFEVDGSVSSLGASDVQEFLTGLGPLASRTVRVRNVWSTGTPVSDWTVPVTGTTEATPTDDPPQSFAAGYNEVTQKIDTSWAHGDGLGNYILEISNTGSDLQAATGTSGWTNISSAISSAATSYSHTFVQDSSPHSRYMRLKRADVSGWVGSGEVIIPAVDPAQAPSNLNVFQEVSGMDFTVTWDDNGATGNNLLEVTGTPFDAGSWDTVDNEATSPVITPPPGLTNGKRWYYRISNANLPGVYAYANARWNA